MQRDILALPFSSHSNGKRHARSSIILERPVCYIIYLIYINKLQELYTRRGVFDAPLECLVVNIVCTPGSRRVLTSRLLSVCFLLSCPYRWRSRGVRQGTWHASAVSEVACSKWLSHGTASQRSSENGLLSCGLRSR
jgi:hypothetical protein